MKLSQVIDALQVLLAKGGDIDLDTFIPDNKPPFVDTAALREEIENGPLAAELAPLWGTVFQSPGDAPAIPQLQDPQKPTSSEVQALVEWKARYSVWEVKTNRAGKLVGDAAYEIHKLLTSPGKTGGPSRAEELGWGSNWQYKLVQTAKEEVL